MAPRPGTLLGFIAGLLAALLVGLAAPTRADEPAVPAWEPTGLSEPTEQLFTPASGAFFARTKDTLLRSDDGGATWRPVAVPPTLGKVAVDPASHAVIYAAGEGGLYKTSDDAASWQLVMPTTWNVNAIAVSPADPSLFYLAIKDSPSIAYQFQVYRTRDGGATWEQLASEQASMCGWGVSILQPHATDPSRVFRAWTCFSGGTGSNPLYDSVDQGTTWRERYRVQYTFAELLAGGRGAAPGRYYLALRRHGQIGGSFLVRSDDDATWTEVLTFPRSRNGPEQPSVTDTQIVALASDPANPDHLFVGLKDTVGISTTAPSTYRVLGSADGGSTWLALSGPDFPKLSALALGIDGQNLYAATERGVLRLPLAP